MFPCNQYCSLQHQTLVSLQDTSTTEHCFCFGPASSFFLELFLHSSLVAYWTPTSLGGSSSSVLSFYLFTLFMGFSRQESWSGLPFPPPVDHVLSELSTMTLPSWVALHGMAPSFTELHKPFDHNKAVIHEGETNQGPPLFRCLWMDWGGSQGSLTRHKATGKRKCFGMSASAKMF